MVRPRQAPSIKGVQNRRFWLTSFRLPGSLVAGIAAGTLPSRFLSHQRLASARLDKKNLDFPNFLATFAAMIGICYTILRYVMPGLAHKDEKECVFALLEVVPGINITRIVYRIRALDGMDARARVFHACVRSNHYQDPRACGCRAWARREYLYNF